MSLAERLLRRVPEVAILLAAGHGTRLKPYTDIVPKPLLIYSGRPVIDYIFDALEKTLIRPVIIVTNYLEERLISHINENFSQRFTLRFCHQKETLGSANALSSTRAAARKYTSTGRPLLISATDYPMPTDYLLELSRFHESHDADISVSLRKISAAKAPHGSRIVESDGELLRIVEKPEDQADGPIIAASLIYIVPPAVFDYADKCPRSKRGEFELPEVINMMIDRGFRAKGFLQQDLIDLDLALHHPSQKCAGHCYPPEDLH